MGLVLDGAPYRGALGAAGEFGHMPYDPDGSPCVCGNRGCLETVVSTESVLRDAVNLAIVPPGSGLAALGAAADRGDTAAVGLLTRAATVLGRALAGAVNLLGPETIYLRGEIVELWHHMEPPFRTALAACLLPAARGTLIDVQPWDDSLVAFGAAGIVLAAPLAVPAQVQERADKSFRAPGTGKDSLRPAGTRAT
jgi:predicted NBD/HSP70 family sugar kinase